MPLPVLIFKVQGKFRLTQLSLRMTDCLFSQMGRTMPPDCIYESAHSCELTGDAWNTFSTFYAHIDNLCHFYWEVLHHERAETLIAQLAASSQASEKLLKANNERTHKILALQETITAHMHTSLDNQFRLQHTLDSSSEKLGALTADM